MKANSEGIWPASERLEENISRQEFPVSELEIQENVWDRPHHARLKGADGSGRERFFFIKKYEVGKPVGEKELFAYQKAALRMKKRITPQCRAAWKEEEELFIVTDDVCATHFNPGSPNPRMEESAFLAVAESYATLHATWWGAVDEWRDFFLRNACFTVSHEAISDETIGICERYFLDDCFRQRVTQWGNDFPAEWRDKTLAAISLWAKLFRKRSRKRDALTLIHGDAHLGNVMVPKDPGHGGPLLIDWEGVCCAVGAWDIARLLHHTNWNESVIAEREPLLLDRYYSSLVSEGVQNYSHEDFVTDYRLSVLAYVPHSLAWGNPESIGVSMRALARWNALDL